MNPPYYEYALVFFDFSDSFPRQMTLSGGNVARLQRTPEGSNQSAGRRSHDLVRVRGPIDGLRHAPRADGRVLGQQRAPEELGSPALEGVGPPLHGHGRVREDPPVFRAMPMVLSAQNSS